MNKVQSKVFNKVTNIVMVGSESKGAHRGRGRQNKATAESAPNSEHPTAAQTSPQRVEAGPGTSEPSLPTAKR